MLSKNGFMGTFLFERMMGMKDVLKEAICEFVEEEMMGIVNGSKYCYEPSDEFSMLIKKLIRECDNKKSLIKL